MPRRKTTQPEPLKRFYLQDGTEIEIIDETCWPIGRGQHSAKIFVQTRLNPIITDLGKILEKPHGVKTVQHILATPTTFAKYIAELGVFGVDGCDDTNARKNWYKKVKCCMESYINAMELHHDHK